MKAKFLNTAYIRCVGGSHFFNIKEFCLQLNKLKMQCHCARSFRSFANWLKPKVNLMFSLNQRFFVQYTFCNAVKMMTATCERNAKLGNLMMCTSVVPFAQLFHKWLQVQNFKFKTKGL